MPKRLTLEAFQALDKYKDIDKDRLREHMAYFLDEIVPVWEESGIRLAVHPDDPPRPILGLLRIVSTIEDIAWLVNQFPVRSMVLPCVPARMVSVGIMIWLI